jgi:hypothetical protein
MENFTKRTRDSIAQGFISMLDVEDNNVLQDEKGK